MTAATNKATAVSYFNDVLNRSDTATADAIFSQAIQFHYPLGSLSGAEAVKDYVSAVRVAFPDIRFTVFELFGEADLVAARWSLRGTQSGPFRDKPATGKEVEVSGNTIFRVVDGRIQEMWIAFDPGALLAA